MSAALLRPRHRFRLAAVLALLAVLAPLASLGVIVPGAPRAGAQSAPLTADEQAHLDGVNEYRRRQGLPAVAVDARAQADARRWAHLLGQRGAIGHSDRVRADCEAGGAPCSGWAENVGRAGSHEEVLERFTQSSGHSANLRRSHTSSGDPYRVGIGIYRRGGAVYVVHRWYACGCDNTDLITGQSSRLAADRAFGRALLADFLWRTGSVAEVDAIAAPLLYGDSRGELVAAVATSEQWIGALVDSYYEATLGRPADAAGKAHWTDVIRAGRTPAEVASFFFASDEYVARVGGTESAWIDDLHRTLLGRAPTDDERDTWLRSRREGWSRSDVSMSIYQSRESRHRRVAHLYHLLLGRSPDTDGWDHWTQQLVDGHDVRLAVHLASSDEYYTRAASG